MADFCLTESDSTTYSINFFLQPQCSAHSKTAIFNSSDIELIEHFTKKHRNPITVSYSEQFSMFVTYTGLTTCNLII